METNIFFLCETFSEGARKLHESLKNSGIPVRTVVIDDDGYLPDGVESVFGYFLKDNKKEDLIDQTERKESENGAINQIYLEKSYHPRYFNEIQIPDYWEITATNSNGEVHDKNKERARIYFAEPTNKRYVKIVDWMDENGTVRYSDHYDKKGVLFARTIFNNRGEKVDRSYFDETGREVIVENYVTKDIILNYDNRMQMFKNRTELTCFFLMESGFQPEDRIIFNSLSTPFFVSQRMPLANEKNDILFWQEPTGDEIPGNMQIIYDGTGTRTGNIYVQNRQSYDRLISLGGDSEITGKLGYVYSYIRKNQGRKEILICTNSDQIESLTSIVEALPEAHFNIAAITEMSSKLMSMETYKNVSLFPGIKEKTMDSLFEKCDFYLDINNGNEIVSAVKRAYYNNMLITGFEETVHNREYTAPEHIYGKAEKDRLVDLIKTAMSNSEFLGRELKIQKNYAMDSDSEKYRSIFSI